MECARSLSRVTLTVSAAAQVCKRWQGILKNPGHGSELWREVIIDFGHELITAVHTPIAWSDRRPSDEEFRYILPLSTLLDTPCSRGNALTCYPSLWKCVYLGQQKPLQRVALP